MKKVALRLFSLFHLFHYHTSDSCSGLKTHNFPSGFEETSWRKKRASLTRRARTFAFLTTILVSLWWVCHYRIKQVSVFFSSEMFLDFHQDQCFMSSSNPYWHAYFSSRECLTARNEQAFSGGNRFPIAAKVSVIWGFSVTVDFIILVSIWKSCLLRKKYTLLFHCSSCLQWIFIVEEKCEKWKNELF